MPPRSRQRPLSRPSRSEQGQIALPSESPAAHPATPLPPAPPHFRRLHQLLNQVDVLSGLAARLADDCDQRGMPAKVSAVLGIPVARSLLGTELLEVEVSAASLRLVFGRAGGALKYRLVFEELPPEF